MTDDCWCCQLADGDPAQKKTRWFYLGSDGAVVEDCNPKRCALRLLFVPSEHFHCGDEPRRLWDMATERLMGVAAALMVENPGLGFGDFDYHRHSYRAHWHAQLGLIRRED